MNDRNCTGWGGGREKVVCSELIIFSKGCFKFYKKGEGGCTYSTQNIQNLNSNGRGKQKIVSYWMHSKVTWGGGGELTAAQPGRKHYNSGGRKKEVREFMRQIPVKLK